MIHLVTIENRALYTCQLEQMHRLRAAYFVEERGWSDRTLRDGGEFDDLDDDEADYLFSLEPDGQVALSARIRPAVKKSMLADHFPELLAEPIASVKAPGVWELSRYFAASRYRGPEGLKRNMELRTAVMAAALRRGAHRIVAVTDVYLMNTVIRTGWEHRFLGLPQSYAHGDAIAFEVLPAAEGVELLMERHGLTNPLLLEARPDQACGLQPQELEVLAHATSVLSRQDIHVLGRIISRFNTMSAGMADDSATELLISIRGALLQGGGKTEEAR